MAKVKFDVSGVDPADAQRGAIEPVQPGIYLSEVMELNPGFSKGDDGKPDKSRKRLEVILRVRGDKDGETEDVVGIGSTLWDYIRTDTESQAWKMDSFLQAFGISGPKKRKGQFDTDDIIGEVCLVRVKSDTNQSGDYRPKVAGYFPAEGLDSDPGEELSDEDLEEDFDDEADDDDEEGQRPDFSGMTAVELKEYAKENFISLKGLKKKADVVAALEAAWDGEGDDEDEDDWDDVFDD